MSKKQLHKFSTRKIALDSEIDYSESCVHCRHSAIHTYEQHVASIAKHVSVKTLKHVWIVCEG
jgi:hypothetical protein